MTEIEQELLMLRSGNLGPHVNLAELVEMDLLSQKAADLYIEELGSKAKIIINDNRGSHEELSKCIPAIG